MIPTTDPRKLTDLFSLKGKVAVVTGGAKGIGRGITMRLVEAGAAVALVDVDEAAALATVAAAAGQGGRALFVRADLASVSEAQAAMKKVNAELSRVDILVNNAGIFPMKPARELDEATWDRVLDLNLKGAFFLAQAAAALMTSGGSIVNIASIDAFHPSGNLAHYDASKGALVMLTRSLALEWAKQNIRVNGIAPGGISTPGADEAMRKMGASAAKSFAERVPLGRMGTPDDIGLAALYLASDASSYVTGQTLIVDGGVLLV